jgi:hypothetical protein
MKFVVGGPVLGGGQVLVKVGIGVDAEVVSCTRTFFRTSG